MWTLQDLIGCYPISTGTPGCITKRFSCGMCIRWGARCLQQFLRQRATHDIPGLRGCCACCVRFVQPRRRNSLLLMLRVHAGQG